MAVKLALHWNVHFLCVGFVRGKELALEIMASDRGCSMQLKREEEILLILVHILRFLFFSRWIDAIVQKR